MVLVSYHQMEEAAASAAIPVQMESMPGACFCYLNLLLHVLPAFFVLTHFLFKRSNVYRCTGNGIWKDKFTCTTCKPCPSGFTHAVPCDGLSFNDTCVECPNCNAGQYKASQWNNATKRMQCYCLECRNNRTCPSTSQYRTFLPCSGRSTFDETCADCPVDSCPMMGTTPNYLNCIEATRKFECLPCPSQSPTEPVHQQMVNCTTCPVNDCSKRAGSYLLRSCNTSAPVTNRTFTCGLCQGCSVRQHLRSWGACDGLKSGASAFNPDTQCTYCKGFCKVGQYLSKLCSGRELYDVEVADGNRCRDCTSCPYGYYHGYHTKMAITRLSPVARQGPVTEQACNGYGMFDSDGATDCLRCDMCPRGQYAIDVGNCTGNNIWKVPFRYSSFSLLLSVELHNKTEMKFAGQVCHVPAVPIRLRA